jgi:hypothetical protein
MLIKQILYKYYFKAKSVCFQCLCAFICYFFQINIDKDNIGAYTANTFVGDNILNFPAENAEHFSGAGDNQSSNAAVAGIKFDICDTAYNFTVSLVDNLFVAKFTNPHDNSHPEAIVCFFNRI